MNNPEKRIAAGLSIIIINALCWMSFGIVSFVLNTRNFAALFQGAFLGAALLLTGFAAYRWRRFGGWALVFEGMIPVYIAVSTGSMDLFVVLAVSIPPIAGGLLFVLE